MTTAQRPAPALAAHRVVPAAQASATASPAAQAVNALSWTIAAVGGFALAFLAFLLVLSPLQQARAQDLLYSEFRSQLAAATAPFGVDPIAPGSPVAVVDVPALELRQVIVEGTAGADLRQGPGHQRATPLPGQVGTSVVYGRSTTYGGPFGDLTSLVAGDRVTIVTGQGSFRYKVDGVRHDGDPEPPAPVGNESRLLLVSTEGTFLRASTTVFVDATLDGSATVTPPHTITMVPPFEAPMASDTSALLPLALWLLVLVGVAAFVVWGVLRWGRHQTWLIAFPLAAAALWGASDAAALLLPNLV